MSAKENAAGELIVGILREFYNTLVVLIRLGKQTHRKRGETIKPKVIGVLLILDDQLSGCPTNMASLVGYIPLVQKRSGICQMLHGLDLSVS